MTLAIPPPPPLPHVFIFKANLSGPPSEFFQSFQRSPLLGSQVRLIPLLFSQKLSDPPKSPPPALSPQAINNDQSLTLTEDSGTRCLDLKERYGSLDGLDVFSIDGVDDSPF